MTIEAPTRTFNPLLPYEERRLPCGAKLLYHHNGRVPLIAIDVWLQTGGCNDPEEWSGISHFYEHMFFKGSEQHGPGELDRLVKSLGGDCNAATACDYTHYDAAVPSAGWREVLDVLVDGLRQPLFDPEELERERQVVIEEIARAASLPWSVLHQNLVKRLFARCPYKREVLGTEECLKVIDRDALHAYRGKRYVPSLTTFCVVGDVDLDQVLEELARLTEGWEGEVQETYPTSWDIIEQSDEVIVKRDVQQAYLAMGRPTGRIVGTPEEYALEAASSVLGEGRSSRLVKRLKLELGIVSSISIGFWPHKYAGALVVGATTTPDQLPKVEEEIGLELARFADEGLSQEELDKVKAMHRSSYYADNERNVSIAGAYGYGDLLTSIEEAVRYQEELERLTTDDVLGAFRRLVEPHRVVTARVLPENNVVA